MRGRRKMPKKSKQGLKIKFASKTTKVITYEPDTKSSYAFHGGGNHILAVAWDIDDAGAGFWRIMPVGLDANGAMLLKDVQQGKTSVAFFGDISIVGAGKNDLFTADGYEDDDMIDAEGNIVNKATEIHVYPSRK